MEPRDQYVIRVKPGQGNLYVGISIHQLVGEARIFTSQEANKWLNEQDDPWSFTIVNLETKKEYKYPDGSPSSL